MSFGGMGGEIKFVVKVLQEEKLKDLEAQMGLLRQKAIALGEAFRQGAMTQAQFVTASKSVEAVVGQISARMDYLRASAGKMGKGMSDGSKAGTFALLEFSRGLEDIQYGFNGVVNNIPGFVMAMGAGAGVAGAVSIAAVAINQLIKNWGYLSDVMQSAWSGAAISQLQAIRKRAEEAAEAWEKLSKAPTKMQAAQSKMIEEAMTEGPIEKVLEGVVAGVKGDKSMRKELSDDEKFRLSHEIGAEFSPIFPFVKPALKEKSPEAAKKAMAEAVDKADREKATELMNDAKKAGPEGDTARNTMARMARENPGAFPEGFARKIAQADPAEQKKGERMRKVSEEMEVEDDIAREREQKRKERNRKADDLNEQGRENERHMREEHDREKTRLAQEMLKSPFGRQMMAGRTGRGFEEGIGRSLAGAGFGDFGGGEMAKEMKKLTDEQIRKTMLEKGVDEGMARKMLQSDMESPERNMRRRVQGIMEGAQAQPERQRAEFVGLGDFAKQTQAGIFNNTQDIQKQQLDALKKLVELLQDNPEMAEKIAGWAGMPALAAN